MHQGHLPRHGQVHLRAADVQILMTQNSDFPRLFGSWPIDTACLHQELAEESSGGGFLRREISCDKLRLIKSFILLCAYLILPPILHILPLSFSIFLCPSSLSSASFFQLPFQRPFKSVLRDMILKSFFKYMLLYIIFNAFPRQRRKQVVQYFS